MTESEWLNQLDLGEYTQLFLENKVEFDVLTELEEDDLRDLGIPLGHRKKMMRAIKELREVSNAAQTTLSSRDHLKLGEGDSGAIAKDAPQGQPERRHMTVMFCDLADSTKLSVELDPEDFREVIVNYQSCVEGIVKRYNGYIADYMGDGVLIYFGYPIADEHAPERAILTGLEIAIAVQQLDEHPGIKLHSRIGIATGNVVVDNAPSKEGSQKHPVLGETPNLAARLQALADYDQVVISDQTKRLIGDLFELFYLGENDLKGFDRNVGAWRVLSKNTADSRFAASRHGGDTVPLDGRDEEVDTLVRRWQQAQKQCGQVVLLSGEAGIGKSRLTQTIQDIAIAEKALSLRLYCSPYHGGSPLHPVSNLLSRSAGIEGNMPADEKLDRLETFIANAGLISKRIAPLYAELLSIPCEHRYGIQESSPQKAKDETLETLAEHFRKLSSNQPLLIAIEDLHWIDPTTQEFLDLFIDDIIEQPVLLLATFRPTFEAQWSDLPHVTSMPLSRLPSHVVEGTIRKIASKPLPPEIVQHIVDKSDGVPLFVEELTKTILESGTIIDAGARYELKGPLPELAIPATLQDSLMARLDRLAPVKEVALIGSVIGRQFSYELLKSVACMHERDLEDALEQLAEAQIIYRRGTIPAAVFTFKHGLVQDAAYNSLLRTKKQRIHGLVAEAMESRLSTDGQEQPEIVAFHYNAAGLVTKAITQFQAAAQLFIGRSAIAEAIDQLHHALELVEQLPPSKERDRKELDLLLLLGTGLTMSKGWATAEAEEVYGRAHDMCNRGLEHLDNFPVYLALHRFHALRGELLEAHAVGESLLDHAELSKDKDYQFPANIAHGYNSFFLGELKRAEKHLGWGVENYSPDQHEFWVSRWGEDPGIVGLGFGALTQSILGNKAKAIQLNTASIDAAEKSQHQFSIGFSKWISSRVHHVHGDINAVYKIADELLHHSLDQKFLAWLGHAMIMRGWALCMTGQEDEGLKSMGDGLAGELGAGALLHRTQYLTLLAEVHGHLGDTATGLDTIADAEKIMRQTSEGYAEPEIFRIKGQLQAMAGAKNSQIMKSFNAAMESAKQRQAGAWADRVKSSIAQYGSEAAE